MGASDIFRHVFRKSKICNILNMQEIDLKLIILYRNNLFTV